MQLDDVPVGEHVLSSNLLPVEAGVAPYTRVAQRALEVLVHEPGNVAHGLSMAHSERMRAVGGMPRGLGVHAYHAEVVKERGTKLAQTVTCARRHSEPGITDARYFAKGAELGIGVGDAIGFVRNQERRQTQRKRVSFACRFVVRCGRWQIPALAQRHLLLMKHSVHVL